MSTRKERAARKNATRCRNCEEFGNHYAPAGRGFGAPGYYICKKKEQP